MGVLQTLSKRLTVVKIKEQSNIHKEVKRFIMAMFKQNTERGIGFSRVPCCSKAPTL